MIVSPTVSEARADRERLLTLIDEAEHIKALEHSHWLDHKGGSGRLEERLYGHFELSDGQREALLRSITNLPAAPYQGLSYCVFAPRHSLILKTKSEGSHRLWVCYSCAKSSWSEDGTDSIALAGLEKALLPHFEQFGFAPERDWQALAKD